MKTKILVLFSFVLIFFSCKGNDAKTTPETTIKENYSDYKEIKFKVKSDYNSDSKNFLEISFGDFKFEIQFVDERSYLKTSFRNKPVKDFQQIVYNFTYDSDFENAEKQVRVIYNGKDGFLLLPSYTEEFRVFNVYRFNNQQFFYDQTIVLETHNFVDGEILVDGKSPEKFVMIDKTSKTKYSFTKDKLYPVSTENEKEDFLKLNKIATVEFLSEFSSDLNKDGKKDKISIYRNEKTKDDFEKTHFDLPVKVTLSAKSGLTIEKTNNNIIFSSISNCISEGFSNVVAKDNFFTIEQQTCYDHNVLVESYLTFKVENNEIYLHKYGETYFDKTNHEKKIPEKIWSVKDFGKIKFENVNKDFLLKLRLKS